MMTVLQRRVISAGVLGVILVAAVDALLGFEISLLVLHIVPVLVVTWYTSWRWGLFFAVLTTLTSVLAVGYLAPPTGKPLYRYLDLGSDFLATVVLVAIQSRLHSAYRIVESQSRTDALTGCQNRNGFNQQLQDEIARQKRYGHAFALVYFDVDNFKAVNDRLGHHVGDTLLVQIAQVMRSRLRNVDTDGRLGGDEFAILLRESGPQAAELAISELKEALDRMAQTNEWPVGFSIGVVAFSRAPDDADHALRLADELMYEAKKGGKNALRMREY